MLRKRCLCERRWLGQVSSKGLVITAFNRSPFRPLAETVRPQTASFSRFLRVALHGWLRRTRHRTARDMTRGQNDEFINLPSKLLGREGKTEQNSRYTFCVMLCLSPLDFHRLTGFCTLRSVRFDSQAHRTWPFLRSKQFGSPQ